MDNPIAAASAATAVQPAALATLEAAPLGTPPASAWSPATRYSAYDKQALVEAAPAAEETAAAAQPQPAAEVAVLKAAPLGTPPASTWSPAMWYSAYDKQALAEAASAAEETEAVASAAPLQPAAEAAVAEQLADASPEPFKAAAASGFMPFTPVADRPAAQQMPTPVADEWTATAAGSSPAGTPSTATLAARAPESPAADVCVAAEGKHADLAAEEQQPSPAPSGHTEAALFGQESVAPLPSSTPAVAETASLAAEPVAPLAMAEQPEVQQDDAATAPATAPAEMPEQAALSPLAIPIAAEPALAAADSPPAQQVPEAAAEEAIECLAEEAPASPAAPPMTARKPPSSVSFAEPAEADCPVAGTWTASPPALAATANNPAVGLGDPTAVIGGTAAAALAATPVSPPAVAQGFTVASNLAFGVGTPGSGSASSLRSLTQVCYAPRACFMFRIQTFRIKLARSIT